MFGVSVSITFSLKLRTSPIAASPPANRFVALAGRLAELLRPARAESASH